MKYEEAIEMMKAKLECMTREVSGVDQDCNMNKCFECDLCYTQGNMGEQKEWLRMGIEALENQKTLQTELEEIKAEIRYNGLYNEPIEEIIDNHIKELNNEIL